MRGKRDVVVDVGPHRAFKIHHLVTVSYLRDSDQAVGTVESVAHRRADGNGHGDDNARYSRFSCHAQNHVTFLYKKSGGFVRADYERSRASVAEELAGNAVEHSSLGFAELVCEADGDEISYIRPISAE